MLFHVQYGDEIAGGENVNAAEGFQFQQMTIAADDAPDISCQRGLEKFVVAGVSFDDREHFGGSDEFGGFEQVVGHGGNEDVGVKHHAHGRLLQRESRRPLLPG